MILEILHLSYWYLLSYQFTLTLYLVQLALPKVIISVIGAMQQVFPL